MLNSVDSEFKNVDSVLNNVDSVLNNYVDSLVLDKNISKKTGHCEKYTYFLGVCTSNSAV